MSPKDKAINVGLLGLGVVGSGVMEALTRKGAIIAKQAGVPVRISRVLVRDLEKPRSPGAPREILTTNPRDILEDPDIDVVVEVMGGERPALDYLTQALEAGKSVVTANKEVMAKHGPDLLALASRKGAHLLFEASVGGGIPILRPLMKDLRGNEIRAVRAIINGTTNYIITKMTYEDVDFPQALREAQDLGYAEPDPTNDVEGFDAAYKLAILASLAFQTKVGHESVYREGISRLTVNDFRYARELGYTVKLMAIAKREGADVEARVHPVLIPQDIPLAKVDGVFNAVEMEGDLVGKVLFHGRGAGSMPTTSAVLGDILEIAWDLAGSNAPSSSVPMDSDTTPRSISDLVTRYYIRITAEDRSGVLAQMAAILGKLQISIASVIQKEADPQAQTAELVITTHPSCERDVQQALEELATLEVVKEIGNLLRVEE